MDWPHIAIWHDIGKLIDWDSAGLRGKKADGSLEQDPHDFEKCTDASWRIDWSARPWQSIFRKDDARALRARHWPQSLDWLWTSLGDQLAAGWGRAISESRVKGEPRWGRHCLWTGDQTADPRLKTRRDVERVIAYLNDDPEWMADAGPCAGLWSRRAEAANPGLNVTSLHAHSVTAAKLAAVLASTPDHPFRAEMTWNEAQKTFARCKLTVMHLRVRERVRPFRVAEWNIFAERRNLLDGTLESWDPHILARTGNECIGVFHSRDQAQALSEALAAPGFEVHARMAEKTIDNLVSTGLAKALPDAWQVLYPAGLPSEIAPPICEACQLAHASHRWPADHLAVRDDLEPATREALKTLPWARVAAAPIAGADRDRLADWLGERSEEHLCSGCFELRRNARKLHRLPEWGGSRVAWIHVDVPLDRLQSSLTALHRAYMASLQPDFKNEQNLHANYPLMVDFLDDFQRICIEFRTEIESQFGGQDHELVDTGLLCVRIRRPRDAVRLLEIFNECARRRTPRLFDESPIPAPIRFAMSISAHKFPFFVHWRFLSENPSDIAVQVVNVGEARFRLADLPIVLRDIGGANRRGLHRLAAISNTSQTLAQHVFAAESKRTHPQGRPTGTDLETRVGFSGLLTLANLVED